MELQTDDLTRDGAIVRAASFEAAVDNPYFTTKFKAEMLLGALLANSVAGETSKATRLRARMDAVDAPVRVRVQADMALARFSAFTTERRIDAYKQIFHTYREDREASNEVFHAAYLAASHMKAAGVAEYVDWFDKAADAFAPKNRQPSVQEVEMLVTARLAVLDHDIDTWSRRVGNYAGTPAEILRNVRADTVTANVIADRVQRLRAYQGWKATAYAREAKLFNHLATELRAAKPNSARNWLEVRDEQLSRFDARAVQQAVRAVLSASDSDATHDATDGIRLLIHLSRTLGHERFKLMAEKVPGFRYRPGMFTKRCPGIVAHPRSSELPAPLPVDPRL